MGKVYTFIADVTPLYEADVYAWNYALVPDFRREKADRLGEREAQAQSVGVWRLWMLAQEWLREREPGTEYPVFNLSHSGKYVLCSVPPAGEKTGCDIEKIGAFRGKLAERFFCPEEYDFLMAQEEEVRRETFYRYWVLKESFMKATRQGMKMGLDTFSIRLDSASGRPELVRQPEDVKETYYYQEYQAPGARIAVCSTCMHFAEKIKNISLNL